MGRTVNRRALAFGAALLVVGAAWGVDVAVVRSLTLNATLDATKKGAVTSLVNADGFDFCASTDALFGVELTRADDFKRILRVSSDSARDVSLNESPAGIELVFTGFDAGIERAVVTVRGDDRLRWRIDVKTKDGWVLEKTAFPNLRLKSVWDGATRDELITTGHSNGGCYRPLDPLRADRGFPTADRPGRMSMQYAGIYAPTHGFYTAAEDPANESKFLRIATIDPRAPEKGLTWRWEWRTWQPNGGAQPYDVVTKGLTGTTLRPLDWRDVADVYREWVMPQKWCAEPIAERKDLPEWMKAGPAKTFFKRCWIADPNEIRRWMNEYYVPTFGTDHPLVVSFWGWEHQDLWVGPDYFPAFPSDEAFGRLTADLKSRGGHTFLWPSGFRWLTLFDKRGDGAYDFDDEADWERVAKPHAVLKRNGAETCSKSAVWWRGGANKEVCGYEPWAVDWFVANAKKMIALGAESVQIDQQGGGYLSPCYARNHGHTPGDGVWRVQGFTRFIEKLRDELKTLTGDLVLGMEAPGDCYNRFWGIQDHRDCEPNHAAEWASTFNWLYHAYVPTFQSNMFMRRYDRPFVAHCAVDGQLPYLVPSRADYAKGESVVWNAGFETVAPNGEFAGWERLRGEHTDAPPTPTDYYAMAVQWNGRAYADTTDVKEGRVAMRLETLNADDQVGVSQDIFTDDAAFVPGGRYRLGAWLKTDSTDAPERCFVEPQVFTEGQLFARGLPRAAFPKAGAGWRRVSVDFTLPAGAHLFRPIFRTGGKSVTRVDGVTLERLAADGTAKPAVFTGVSSHRRFVEQWARAYHGESRKFLAHGSQIRGPKVSCRTFRYYADCHVNLIYTGHPDAGGADIADFPVVVSQAYEASDGTKALALANATDRPQKATWLWRGKRFERTLAPDELAVVALPEEKILSKHDYLTDEALATADMDGVADEIAAALAKCDAAFSAAEKLLGDEVRCRLVMARRLKNYVAKRAAAPERDEQILAWQGAMELEAFFDYFVREAKRAAEKASAPPAKVFDVRDFGAKGDGKADDSAAFRAAFEAARKLDGAPSVIRVPAGDYRLTPDPRGPIANYACNDWQTGDLRGKPPAWKGERIADHLIVENLENMTLCGEGEKSRLVFTDSTRGGIHVCGCREIEIADLALDYPDNPSTQGTVERVETEPFALVLRRDKGYPDPDSPRFVNATSRYFSPVGKDMMYLPGGVARMGTVERLGEDLFRLVPYAHHRDNEVWRSCRTGMRICIMARYAESAGASPLRFFNSAFSGARNVRVFDSPGQVFSQANSYATRIVGCKAIGRDGSDDIVTSNADACIGAGLIGPYISDCTFSGLEDDGTNVGTNTGEIPSIPGRGYLSQSRTGGGQPAKGGLLIDGVNGRCKMFMRYGKNDVATRPLPADTVPATAVLSVSEKDRRKFDFNTAQKKGVKRADRLVRIPGTVGAVLRNTAYSRLRGRGIQVHCGNMLVEDVRVSDVTGVGIAVNALLPWGMCYDVHNVYVRNCVFERLGGTGAACDPSRLVQGEPLRQRMHFSLAFENCVFTPRAGSPAAILENDDDVLFENCTFNTSGVRNPVRVINSTNVTVR